MDNRRIHAQYSANCLLEDWPVECIVDVFGLLEFQIFQPRLLTDDPKWLHPRTGDDPTTSRNR
jgi:hypothetical protein